MSGVREWWKGRSAKAKVLWSVGAVFVLLIVIGAATGSSNSNKTATVTVAAKPPPPPTAAEVAQKQSEARAAKAREANEAKEHAATERKEAAARRHEERVKKTREAHEHQEEKAKEAAEHRATEERERRENEPTVVGSGQADGEYAIASATGTAKKTSQIALHVAVTPEQSGLVTWTMVCQENSGGVGSKSGQSTLSLPTTEHLPIPAPSESCDVSASVQMNGSGHVELQILG